MTKEFSKPYGFLKEKKRKILHIDKEIWDKMNWRAQKTLIDITEIIEKEDKDGKNCKMV